MNTLTAHDIHKMLIHLNEAARAVELGAPNSARDCINYVRNELLRASLSDVAVGTERRAA